MTPEILHALVWRMRSSLRCGRAPMHAAHGYADPAYRPPRLPFVSVVGPTGVEIEPLCDTQRPPQALVLTPGHVIGQPRAPGHVVAGGQLRVRVDGTATLTAAGIAGRALVGAADGEALAAAIEGALRDAVRAGAALGPDAQPVAAEQRAELLDLTVRWDPASRRFAIASGRRGVVDGPRRSSVEVLPGPASIAADLGLADAPAIEGRVQRHELTVPQAMLVDIRLDLWAASQSQLAALVDDLTRRFPGRGRLLTAPSLLADDLHDGDRRLRLLAEGQPIGRFGWVLLEAGDSLRDRVSGATFSGDAVDHTPRRIRFDATHRSVRMTVSPASLVPDPFEPEHLAPRGLALAVGFVLPADVPADGVVPLASLDHGDLPALRLVLAAAPPNGGPQLDIVATATLGGGAQTGTATTRWRVPAARLRSRVVLHAAVVAATGAVELALDGAAAPDAAVTVRASGAPRIERGMVLTVGGEGDAPLEVDFVHLLSEPLGPHDPRLRRSAVSAAQWPPGRRIRLARSVDGVEAGAERFATTIVAVEGDVLHVDPPIVGAWDRGRTIVFAEEYFVQQAQVRRKDDLLNQLYRATGEYRVSAHLDDDRAEDAPVQVVESADLTVHARGPAAPELRERAGA